MTMKNKNISENKWDGSKNVPGNMCDFVLENAVCFAETNNEKKLVKLVGYRGDVISHWYWGNLAFDMDGLHFDKPRTPGLIDHETSKRLTYSTERGIKPETYIAGPFLDNANAQEVANDMKNDFPFQASLRLKPEIVEQVMEGQSVEVNGKKLKGPGAIFRKAAILEISAVVFGAFSNTESAAYSDMEQYNFELSNERNFDMLTLEKFKDENPDLYEQVFKAGKSEGEKETTERFSRLQKACGNDNELLVKCFSENLDTAAAMEKRIEKMSAENAKLAEQLSAQNSKLSTQNSKKVDPALQEFSDTANEPGKETNKKFNEAEATDDQLKEHFKQDKKLQEVFTCAEAYVMSIRKPIK